MDETIQKLKTYIRENQMLNEGDRVIAGVSGGADSMCLFYVLLSLRESMGISLEVVHVEHGIRGEASREDAAFVEAFCERERIPFHLVEENVALRAKSKRLSVEEAGREVRYEAFYRILTERNGDKIAVAHNKNDQAETVLFNLFRGAGIRGLGGIRPVNERIIRPLLCLEREEILSYLEDRQIPYKTDATNQDISYARNRIRHEILPPAARISGRAVEHISAAAALLREADAYLLRQADAVFEKYVSYDADVRSVFIPQEVEREEPVIRQYLYLLCLKKAAGGGKDLSAVHVENIASLMEMQTGRQVQLPGRITALRQYGGILLRQGTQGNKAPEKERGDFIQIKVPGSYRVSDGRSGTVYTAAFTLEQKKENQEIPEKSYTKWFDYDKIKFGLSLRKRKEGDYITIGADGGRQKLKSFFINRKVPCDQRDSIWLLADGAHVLWIIGYRISESYKVTEQTDKILRVQLSGGEKDE